MRAWGGGGRAGGEVRGTTGHDGAEESAAHARATTHEEVKQGKLAGDRAGTTAGFACTAWRGLAHAQLERWQHAQAAHARLRPLRPRSTHAPTRMPWPGACMRHTHVFRFAVAQVRSMWGVTAEPAKSTVTLPKVQGVSRLLVWLITDSHICGFVAVTGAREAGWAEGLGRRAGAGGERGRQCRSLEAAGRRPRHTAWQTGGAGAGTKRGPKGGDGQDQAGPGPLKRARPLDG